MGVISSRLVFEEGMVTYPTKANLDWTGEGTEASPYIITTPQQLIAFGDEVNAGNSFKDQYVALGNDIVHEQHQLGSRGHR